FGICAFPCWQQNRGFARINEDGSDFFVGAVSKTNRTTLEVSVNGSSIFTQECYARSGPFTVIKRTFTSGDFYSCSKNIITNGFPDVLVSFVKPLKRFDSPPTVCDVCDGDFPSLQLVKVQLPDIGCTIPSVCPVTSEGQIRCPECFQGSELFGDGVCCEETEFQ
ncbi:Hypothetical predicted protein, partial [Mytilus galloprovincialis]